MKKKILIVGNGAKEYALAKKLSGLYDIYVTPSGDMLKEFAVCLDIREDNVSELLEFVLENSIDMTVVTSEVAIKSDIVTLFGNNKQPIFAPSAKAAEIIYDKGLAKKTMYKLKIPTPKFGIFDKLNLALDYIKKQDFPCVIKTNDSNSAVIVTTSQTAKNILENAFIEKNNRIIIEDYVYGTPFSFYTITDGYKALPIGSSITYKYSLEGNGGQLTSGRGAGSPNYKLSLNNEYFLMENVIYPTIEYLDASEKTYLGILGVNGIIDKDGNICILGWQSFMNDCDAPNIIENIEEDLYDLFLSCTIGSFSDEKENINQSNMSTVSLVLACNKKDNKENIIKGCGDLDENIIQTFYPSVNKNRYLEYEANSGPVMILTSKASTLNKASEDLYEEVKCINFSGLSYRKDICKITDKI